MIRWRLAQSLEIRWWKWYLQKKEPRRYLAQKKAYWERILAKAELDTPTDSYCLDAGCGPAGIFMALDEHKVDAVDPLLDQYQDQLDHFAKAKYPWTQFYNQRLEDWDPPRSYDYIFCMNAINHVADWEQALDHLTKAARPGSTLLLGVDVHRRSFLQKIFRFLPGDLLHPHQHMRSDYLEAMQKRKWRVIKTVTDKQGAIFDYWLVVAEMNEF